MKVSLSLRSGLFAATASAALLTGSLQGQVIPYINDFSGGFTTIVPAGSSEDTGPLDTNIENGFDIDNFALYGPDDQWQNIGFSRMENVTNDGVNGDALEDGAVRLNSFDANPSGGLLQLDGTMEEGVTYELSTWVFNRNSSYVNFTVSLHNLTDDVELANTGNIVLNNDFQDTGDGLEQTLSYTALASDVGDTLQVRYERASDFNTARDIYIDSVAVVPEPSHAALAGGILALLVLFHRRRIRKQ